jgi:hypothetical protein
VAACRSKPERPAPIALAGLCALVSALWAAATVTVSGG